MEANRPASSGALGSSGDTHPAPGWLGVHGSLELSDPLRQGQQDPGGYYRPGQDITGRKKGEDALYRRAKTAPAP